MSLSGLRRCRNMMVNLDPSADTGGHRPLVADSSRQKTKLNFSQKWARRALFSGVMSLYKSVIHMIYSAAELFWRTYLAGFTLNVSQWLASAALCKWWNSEFAFHCVQASSAA